MNIFKNLFHKISYLQYPLVAVSLYFYVLFIMSMMKDSMQWAHLNSALVFYGISISLSTLQDTTKTQNNFSKKIWEHPKKGIIALALFFFLALTFMAAGLMGFLYSSESIHKEISFGLIVLSIGLIGLLKSAMEMFDNHRLDKKSENAISHQ